MNKAAAYDLEKNLGATGVATRHTRVVQRSEPWARHVMVHGHMLLR